VDDITKAIWQLERAIHHVKIQLGGPWIAWQRRHRDRAADAARPIGTSAFAHSPVRARFRDCL